MSHMGSKHAICRRAGAPLCGSPHCPALKRPYPGGQHGQKRQRQSNYGRQLFEKQKLKFIYGVKERQFRRHYQEAIRDAHIPTGIALLQRLETRLDSIVYRIGYARSIHGARQLVVHGHVKVNGKTVDRPSYRVAVDSTVHLTDSAKQFLLINESLDDGRVIPPYLLFHRTAMTGTLTRLPEQSELPVQVDPTLIVEYYAHA